LIIPNSQGSKLDPSSRNGLGAKMGIDATIPVGAPEMRFRRIRVPGESEVALDTVIDASRGADWRGRRSP
jgi:2,5-furandicarboxylate decarboxylase 1